MNIKRWTLMTLIAGTLVTGCSGLSTTRPENTSPGVTTSADSAGAKGETTTANTAPPQTSASTQTPATAAPVTTTPVATQSEAERLVEEWGSRIYPGVTVAGIDIGGLSFKEAEKKVGDQVRNVLARRIPFKVGKTSFEPTQKELGLTISTKNALAKAKSAYDIADLEEKAEALIDAPKLNFKVGFSVDDEKLSEYVKTIASSVDREATSDVSGRTLLKKTLQEKLDQAIIFSVRDAKSFPASVKTEPKIVLVVSTQPEPETKPDSTTPSATTPSSKPASTAEQGTIARGTSKFSESSVERSDNIKLATSRINKVVVEPGQVFSTLKWMKTPNASNGYKNAPVFAGGTMVDGPGGGVCQVSSTLYNAVIRAGLEIVERHTHGFSVSYLPLGMDATVYAPSKDFKFRNTLDHPITIRGSASDGVLTFRIVTNEDAMGGISYKFTQPKDEANRTVGEKHWNIIETDELPTGEEEILVVPHPAASQKVYRKTYKNGKLIKTEFFDKVTYRELVGVKRVGI